MYRVRVRFIAYACNKASLVDTISRNELRRGRDTSGPYEGPELYYARASTAKRAVVGVKLNARAARSPSRMACSTRRGARQSPIRYNC